MPTIHEKLGVLYYDQTLYKQAIFHLRSCIKSLEGKEHTNDQRARTTKKLCDAFEKNDELSKAISTYDELISLLRAIDSSRDQEISEAHFSRGTIFYRLSEDTKALDAFEKSLDLKRNCLFPDEVGISKLLKAMAETNVRRGNFVVAAELIREVCCFYVKFSLLLLELIDYIVP